MLSLNQTSSRHTLFTSHMALANGPGTSLAQARKRVRIAANIRTCGYAVRVSVAATISTRTHSEKVQIGIGFAFAFGWAIVRHRKGAREGQRRIGMERRRKGVVE